MTQKIAYLTIDDSPTKDFLQKLDYLIEKEIPALWFCEGARMEQYPDSVITAIQKGHIIGNHSYSHPHFSQISLDQAREEIQRTDAILEDIYAKSGVERPAKFFRFPYGDKGSLSPVFTQYSEEGQMRHDAIQQYLRDLGYTQLAFEGITYPYYHEQGLLKDVDWYWTYDCLEWAIAHPMPSLGIDSLEKVFARMDENEPEAFRGLNDDRSEEIILLHDHVETTDIFQPIIERLLAKGIEFRAIPM